MAESIKYIPVKQIFWQAYLYMQNNLKQIRLFWLANFALFALYSLIPQDAPTPLPVLAVLSYYYFLFVFFRVYFHKKPYFLTMDFFGSVIPSTKMFFFMFVVVFLLVILPFLPLFMGFNEQYLLWFEKYMAALQNIEGSILNQMVFAAVLLFLSPFIISRPTFAWLSALQGLNGSMHKAFRKTQGNYWRFVLVIALLDIPCFAAYGADVLLGCHNWLFLAFGSLFCLYFSVVFAKLYDFFYTE